MSYIIRDARGKALGMLPDSLRAVGQAVERHSPACAAGQEYAESGEPGTLSSAIVWNIPIATDRDILVRSK